MKIKKIICAAVAAATAVSTTAAFAMSTSEFDNGMRKGINYFNNGMYYEARDEFQWFADYNWGAFNSGQQQYLLDYLDGAKANVSRLENAKRYNQNSKSGYYSRAKEIENYENTVLTGENLNSNLADIYRKWDTLLNDVYQYLKSTKDEYFVARMETGEINWIYEKENAMQAAADEYYGGTMAVTCYYSVGIDYTKERVYELINLID